MTRLASTRGAHLRREAPRKAIHGAAGLVALALPFLDRETAALGAAGAVVVNIFWRALDRGDRFFRPGEGWFGGIVLYPVVVLAAILLLPYARGAMAVWGVLAFGDAAATLVGLGLGGPRWPGGSTKTFAGSGACLVIGGLAAGGFLLAAGLGPGPALLRAFAAAAGGALFEVLPLRLDDNLLVGAGAAAGFLLVEALA